MKILVTGGAGFIGSHVVDKYLEHNHQVIVVDDLSTGRLSNLNPLAKFYKLNISDPEIRRVFIDENPEIINHHAAQIDVRRSVADPKFDAEVNILGSLHLLELAREFVVKKFIHISSGGAIYGEPVYLPCDESHPVQPLSPYGASKYSFELYLYIYKTIYNLEYTILRYANVYGPRQDPLGEAGVVAIFTGQMLNNQPVTINGNGEQLRDFIYVGDVAEANLAALHLGNGSAYNLGVGEGTSITRIFNELSRITNYPHEAKYGPPKAGEAYKIFLDTTKARDELNWEPKVDLKTGLENTVQYFIKNRSG